MGEVAGRAACSTHDARVMGAAPFWDINAFTRSPDGGNPAGVMLLEEWPADDELQAIAREIGLPATAFVVAEGADYTIAWFSPSAEIALCGHASLAAGHALLERDGGNAVRLRTRRSGVVTVQRSGEGVEVALPLIETRPAEHSEGAALLGLASSTCWRSDLGYNLFVLENEGQVRSLAPNFEGLAKLPTDQFIVTAKGTDTDIVSRVFKGGAGAGEDSVTGSAHAVLAPYWAKQLGRETLTAHQASARGGDLTLSLEGKRVWVGGQCVTLSKA